MRDRVGRNFKEKKKTGQNRNVSLGVSWSFSKPSEDASLCLFFIALMDFSVAGFSEV